MEKILMYITNHYMVFVIAAIALIIAAIGYVVDENKQELDRSKDVPMDDDQIKEQMEKENNKDNTKSKKKKK
jgi:short subunit fatty acids transporter